jgi:GNAT superfamily N-acetyltransferase
VDVRIRPARPGEAARLREIAIAAKAHWGYEEERVREWGEGLEYTSGEVHVAELGGEAVAYASLVCHGELCELDELWVDPGAMGRGVGTLLFRFAADRARRLGARRLEWESDPNAVGFYERMGGRYIRDSEPSEWGRILPVMGIELERR